MLFTRTLRLPALEVLQGPSRRLYCFAVDGKQLPLFTTISRLVRQDKALLGYQRPEVIAHISEIRKYLESDSPLLPNAIVVAFDGRITFEPAPGERDDGAVGRPGTLLVPVDETWSDAEKPGWIVDGQQRVAAIRDARIERFPVCVVGFVAASNQEQREQFILVNSTKPLPKGLVYELLPGTESRLPSALERRRFPTVLLERLNLDEDSPLQGLVRTPTMTTGTIKDNSLLKMLENSLSEGALFRFRSEAGEGGDIDGMLGVLKAFWGAVEEVFRAAWRLPPRRSRLMHGAGVISLGFLMDAITDRHRQSGPPPREQFRADLEPLRDICRWTDGHWDFGPGTQRKWNEIQNTPKDIQLLANYLLVQYKVRVWNRKPAESEA
jgi:DGQHR domain-containing protein